MYLLNYFYNKPYFMYMYNTKDYLPYHLVYQTALQVHLGCTKVTKIISTLVPYYQYSNRIKLGTW